MSPVILKLLGVVDLELLDLLLVLLLSCHELSIVVCVELLVLLDVGLLNFFLALLVRESQLLVLHVELLLLQLQDAVFGHFSLCSQLHTSKENVSECAYIRPPSSATIVTTIR